MEATIVVLSENKFSKVKDFRYDLQYLGLRKESHKAQGSITINGIRNINVFDTDAFLASYGFIITPKESNTKEPFYLVSKQFFTEPLNYWEVDMILHKGESLPLTEAFEDFDPDYLIDQIMIPLANMFNK